MDVCRERLERLNGGIDVGRLGIVVVLDSVDGGYVLQSVLDCLKVADCFADSVRLAAQQGADADRSQNVFHVMPTLQRNFGDQHNLSLTTAIAEEDAPIVDEGSLLPFSRPAEPEHLCPGASRQF